ncbi:MAG: DUF4838 domain-containing protein [Gemmatimonadota bacterium]
MRGKMATMAALAALVGSFPARAPAAADAPPAADAPAWENALQPVGAAVELTLALDGRPLYQILLPAVPTPQEQVAAEELARWLGQMVGAPFPVRGEGRSGRGTVISIGRTARLRDVGLPDLEDGLGREGYAIAAVGQDLFLTGGSARGPIPAVMALLEEDLGCRWYTATVSRIPAAPTLKARIVPRRYAPPFELRDPFSFVSNDPGWALHNRVNAYGATLPPEQGGNLSYAPGWFVHTYNQILASNDSNFTACPECFMLDADGTRSVRQLCPTHPHVVERAIDRVTEVLEAHPEAELVSVSQNDIRGYCHCDRCMALIGPEGTPAAALLYLVNAVADAVATAHPAVTITTLGYQDTVPAPRALKPAPTVAIRLATDVTWADPFAPASTSDVFMAALTGWEQVADRIHIWDYQVNFGDYFQPWPSFHAKAENLRLFAQHHVTGVMIQGAYQGPGNERQLLRAWVFAKLLWDPWREVWPLMQDFARGYYGPAAPPLEAYNRLLYECGLARQGVIDCVGAEGFVERASALFEAAESRAAGNAEILERVKLARLPVLDLALPLARGRWVASQSDADLATYAALLDTFAAVARRQGVRQYAEGMGLEGWLDQRLAFVSPPAGPEERTARLDGQPVRLYRLPATWRLRRDPEQVGQAEAWHAAGLDEAGWGAYRTDLRVGWEEQGYPGTDGVFWFRTRVTVPANLRGRHVYLYFGACDEEAWVWVDGRPLGERTVASTGRDPSVLWMEPFALEATGRLTAGRDCALAVRVRDSGGMGGLYMPVYAVASEAPLTAAQIAAAVGERNPYAR